MAERGLRRGVAGPAPCLERSGSLDKLLATADGARGEGYASISRVVM
jgi:hypothetical protein